MARNAKQDDDGIKIICRNKRAFHEYQIHETIECGLVLTGTEVKSLREGGTSLDDAYAKVDGGEVWLLGCDIPEYTCGNRLNHKPKRPRKLLLHRREIARFAAEVCLLCADVCEACGSECEKHEPEHCQRCAEACHRCAEECRRMAAAGVP